MKLFLTSSGFDENIAIKLDGLTKTARDNLVIDMVINAKKHKTKAELEDSINGYVQFLQSLGYQKINIIDLDNAAGKDLEGDILYLIGGNTFYLLDAIRRNNFALLLKKFINRGGIVVGQSAGSYVLCPNIEMASWKHQDRDIVGLDNLEALGLVSFLVTVHYDTSMDEAIKKGASKAGLKTYALKDGEALYVENQEVEYINGEQLMIVSAD